MSKFDITTSVFYKWRYLIGYGIIFIALIGLLFVAGVLIPGAGSHAELHSIVTTSQVAQGGITSVNLVDAPFHLLQHLSLFVFGVTLLGIKLPSLILGAATAVCMVLLLRRWFSPGIAVLASLIVVTTGQFLFVAQSGSTGILYLFWPTILLLLATLVANKAHWSNIWTLLLAVVAALSLYTPLSVYILIAMASATVLHPHLRHLVRHLDTWKMPAGIGMMLVLLLPLIIGTVRDPSISLSFFGIPDAWPNIWANLQTLFGQYFGFMSLGTDSVLLPIFGLASMLIILYGLVRLIKTYATVQSYVVLAWIVLLLPVLIINPTFVSIMFVPLLLLLASGLEGILRRWYDLFPKNPYARVTGLIPLVVLVSSMVLFGLDRYAYAYRYAPDTVNNFSRDILIVPDTPTLVVASDETQLYEAVSRYDTSFKVTTVEPASGTYAVTQAAYNKTKIPSGVITSPYTKDAARFYIYK